MYEKIIIWLVGRLARWIGVIPAYTAAIWLCHATAAISFYACARFFRCRREWAFAGALIFAFIYHQLFCNVGGQLFRTFIYTVPFALLTTWLVSFSRRMKWFDRSCWICIVTSLVMGLSFPYTLWMFLQFLFFSILFQWILRRRKENLQIGFACFGLALVAFFAIHLNTLAYGWVHGKNSEGMSRHYLETEIYSLKPMELIVPPTTHHWELFSRIGYLYQSQAMVKGEIFSPYLGLAGLAGLIWIMVEALQAMMRRGPRRVPVQALQCVWVLLYATLGGMNCLLGLAGIMFFRASNRYSVIIATLALLFLAMRLSRLSLRWPRHVSWVAAGVVAMVALTDQLPVKTEAAETTMLREHVNNDERLAKEMEAKLPVGAAVFQMPAMVFPEALPIGQLLGYEMFAPYVYTKHLRFSFGSTRGRTREEWQWEVEKMPVPQMIESLEKFGFSAIYINRKAYADHADDLLKKLGEAGCKTICEDDMHDLICVELKPSSSPELPHTDDRAQIVLKKGWIIHERTPLENQQWSDGDASLTFFTDQKQVTSYSLKCGIGSISLRHVSIEIKGHEVWSGEIPAGKAVPVVLTLDGWPGNNTIQFKTDQPPVKPNDSAPPLAFTVINLQIIRELPH